MVFERIKNFFLIKREYDEVLIHRDVIENIIGIARATHPLEFIALLRGEVKDKKLVIIGLIYQNYTATSERAMMEIRVPIMAGVVGSVHSHPSPSNRPSRTDIEFFNKRGGVNLIISVPYNINTIGAYNKEGVDIPVRMIED